MGVVSWKDPGSGYDVAPEQAVKEETMGQRIRKERKRCGMSQDELGLEVNGVSRMTVSQWERDKRFPGHKNLEKLAEALGVHLSYLLLGAEKFNENYADLTGLSLHEKRLVRDYIEELRQSGGKTGV